MHYLKIDFIFSYVYVYLWKPEVSDPLGLNYR